MAPLGRPRRYHTNADRQRAYRQRKRPRAHLQAAEAPCVQIGDHVTLSQGDAQVIAAGLQHIDALDAAMLAAGLQLTAVQVSDPNEDEEGPREADRAPQPVVWGRGATPRNVTRTALYA